MSLICSSHFWLFLLLTTIHSIVLQLMVSSFFTLSTVMLFCGSCSFLSASTTNSMSYAYFMLLINLSSNISSFRIAWLKMSNKSCEKTHSYTNYCFVFTYLIFCTYSGGFFTSFRDQTT